MFSNWQLFQSSTAVESKLSQLMRAGGKARLPAELLGPIPLLPRNARSLFPPFRRSLTRHLPSRSSHSAEGLLSRLRRPPFLRP